MKQCHILWLSLLLFLVFTSHSESQQSISNQYWYMIEYDNELVVYAIDPMEAASQEQLRISTETGTQLLRAELSPDGNWLAYVMRDRAQSSVYLLDTQTGQSQTIISGEFEPPFVALVSTEQRPMLSWSPDSQRLLIHVYEVENISESDQFYIYDVSTSALSHIESEADFIDQAVWSSDGLNLLTLQSTCMLGSGCESTAMVWSVQPLSINERYDTEDFAITSGEGICEVRWSSDGRFVAHMEYCWAPVTPDVYREVYVYDTLMRQSTKVTDFTNGASLNPPLITAQYSLHWSASGDLLIGVSSSNTSGQLAQTLRYDPYTKSLTVIDSRSGEDWIASHSGQYIAYRMVHDYTRSAYSARIINDESGNFSPVYEQAGPACDFTWSMDDRWLAYTIREYAAESNVCDYDVLNFTFVDLASGQEYVSTPVSHESVFPLGWIQTDNQFPDTGLSAQTDPEYAYSDSRIAMSRDGQILAVSGRAFSDTSARFGTRYPIDLYDAASGNLLSSFNESEDQILSLTLNSDGSLLAYTNGNGRFAIVDVQTNNEINVIVQGGFTSIGYPVFGRDNRTIASFTTTTLELFDAFPPRKRLSTYTDAITGEIYGFDYSADGTLIAYSTNSLQTSSGILVLITIQPDFTTQFLRVVDAPVTLSVAVSDDGTKVASASNNGVIITDVGDGSQYLLPGNNAGNGVFSVDWSDDGTKVVAGGINVITVWDAQTGDILEVIHHNDVISDVMFSPDGQMIYHTGGPAGIYRNGIPLISSPSAIPAPPVGD